MSFMHEIKKDIDRNYFNEFAENVVFCGIRLKALLNFKKFEKKIMAKYGNEDGLIRKGVILVVKEDALPLLPNINEKVSLNHKEYRVLAINRELKLLEIMLEQEVENVWD